MNTMINTSANNTNITVEAEMRLFRRANRQALVLLAKTAANLESRGLDAADISVHLSRHVARMTYRVGGNSLTVVQDLLYAEVEDLKHAFEAYKAERVLAKQALGLRQAVRFVKYGVEPNFCDHRGDISKESFKDALKRFDKISVEMMSRINSILDNIKN